MFVILLRTSTRTCIVHTQTQKQDDCISVKDDSEHMLFERINASGMQRHTQKYTHAYTHTRTRTCASGLGLTIGSIIKTKVNNITFRDCYMHKTYKGIYMKMLENYPDAGGAHTHAHSLTHAQTHTRTHIHLHSNWHLVRTAMNARPHMHSHTRNYFEHSLREHCHLQPSPVAHVRELSEGCVCVL